MANNPQYMGGSGPPLRPMVGSMAPMQNIPPPMPPQFRPVVPMHPPQHFTPSQQYQPLGQGMPPMNIGMPPSQSHQMQFAQPIQQAPVRPLPPGPPPPLMSQPIPMQVPNVALNRPDMQAQSSFPPSSGGVPVQLPPVYAPNSFTTAQFQPVSQINLQSNSTPGPPPMASANQGAALFTPVHQTAQPSPSVSNNKAADSQPTPAEQPSSDWLEHMKNGRRYYYNKKTRQSTWEKPLELMSPIERADATTDWKEFTSLDGRKYFYNKVTKQSKWLIPEELKVLAREQAEKASCTKEVSEDARALSSTPLSDIKTPSNAENPVANSTPNKVTPEAVPYTPPPSSSPALANLPHHNPGTQANAAEVQPPSVNSPAVSGNVDANAASTKTLAVPMSSSKALSAQQAADSSQNVGEKDTEDAKPSTSISGKNTSALDDKPVERETPAYATKQEAKDAFKALLESVNVESDWTWEQTMRLIINDKRYGALKSLGERKQTFNEYLSHKKKQEAEERRARNKKAKEDFRKMLEECNELTSSTRWGKAVNMFGNDERFNAIERARDREDMFEEYLNELEEKEQAKAEEDHLRYILEYRKFLESCDFIKGNSQWRKVKDRLEVDERCSRLETMDRLKYFQEYVGDLEKEEEEQRRLQKEEIRKVERKNRDEFRKLMDAHISDGTLTAKTLWREYHSKVKDIPAYQAVASNSSGSTPKELFEDVAEELSKKYEEARSLIKDTVKSEKIPLASTWTLEDFKTAIADAISDVEVSEDNLKLIFEELLERVREKEEKEAKRRKRLGDEFFNILCSIKDITVDSTFEDSIHLFEDCDEYRAIIDEEALSKQTFEEYLVELREKEKERKRKEEKLMKEERERERERERQKQREKRSRDRREKDRKRDRDRGKDGTKRDEEEGDRALSDDVSGSRKSVKDKERKRRKRHHDADDSSSDKNEDYSRSSHRHSSERKKSRHADLGDSDDSKHKKHKKEHHNGSRRKADDEELEDGELEV